VTAAEPGSFTAEQWTFRVLLVDLGRVSHPALIFPASPHCLRGQMAIPGCRYWQMSW